MLQYWCNQIYFRSGIHKRQVTFFRASEYISQDFKQYGVSKEKTESRIDVKEKLKDEELYKDREAQIKAIEKTFEDARVSWKRDDKYFLSVRQNMRRFPKLMFLNS